MGVDFDVSVVNRNGRAIVFMAGEIDLTARTKIHDALRTVQVGSADVIVDLTQVTFMDSTGINALVGARRRAPHTRFQVVGASPRIQRVFEITGVAQYLQGMNDQADLSALVEDVQATGDLQAATRPQDQGETSLNR